jgi:hypothetical protein
MHGKREKKEFRLPGSHFQKPFSIPKKMIPPYEDILAFDDYIALLAAIHAEKALGILRHVECLNVFLPLPAFLYAVCLL